MNEKSGETWEETTSSVSKLLEDKLQLPAIDLERAHRVGQVRPSQPRAVVVRFEKFQDREAVLRSARKLKGTGTYINEDLCPASQEIKKSQFPLMKQARQEGKVAYFKHTRLIIKERIPYERSTPVAASLHVGARVEPRNVNPTACGVGAVSRVSKLEAAAVEGDTAKVKVTPKDDEGTSVSGDADRRTTDASTERSADDAMDVSPEATVQQQRTMRKKKK